MMKRLMLLCGLVALFAVPAAFAGNGSISLDQAVPAYGGSVTFTITATGNAGLLTETVICSQASGAVYVQSYNVVDPTVKPVFYLGGSTQDGAYTWSAGAASCQANLASTDSRGRMRVIANTYFAVAA